MGHLDRIDEAPERDDARVERLPGVEVGDDGDRPGPGDVGRLGRHLAEAQGTRRRVSQVRVDGRPRGGLLRTCGGESCTYSRLGRRLAAVPFSAYHTRKGKLGVPF